MTLREQTPDCSLREPTLVDANRTFKVFSAAARRTYFPEVVQQVVALSRFGVGLGGQRSRLSRGPRHRLPLQLKAVRRVLQRRVTVPAAVPAKTKEGKTKWKTKEGKSATELKTKEICNH